MEKQGDRLRLVIVVGAICFAIASIAYRYSGWPMLACFVVIAFFLGLRDYGSHAGIAGMLIILFALFFGVVRWLHHWNDFHPMDRYYALPRNIIIYGGGPAVILALPFATVQLLKRILRRQPIDY